MAKMKTISIEAKLDEKFKVEVKAGDRTMYVDQPKAAGGTDAGPNPLEYFSHLLQVALPQQQESLQTRRESN